jgi:hypothetical protein
MVSIDTFVSWPFSTARIPEIVAEDRGGQRHDEGGMVSAGRPP